MRAKEKDTFIDIFEILNSKFGVETGRFHCDG